jgi:predicted patatin/cPLA2 family phospholipase
MMLGKEQDSKKTRRVKSLDDEAWKWSLEYRTFDLKHLSTDSLTTLKQYEHTTALLNHLQKRERFNSFQSDQTCYSSRADRRKICSVIVVYDGFN